MLSHLVTDNVRTMNGDDSYGIRDTRVAGGQLFSALVAGRPTKSPTASRMSKSIGSEFDKKWTSMRDIRTGLRDSSSPSGV